MFRSLSNSKQSYYDYIVLFLVCQVYTIGYWIRGAIAPITDVLEDEFNANASEIGLLSSILYISYVVFQLPSGLLLQIYSGEFIILTSAFGLGITSLLFSYSPNIQYATILHFFNGVFVTPAWISVVSIAAQRFGSQNTALLTGMMIFWCKLFLIGLTTFQAVIYEQYSNWRLPFVLLTISLFIICVIVLIFVVLEQAKLFKTNTDHNPVEKEMDTFIFSDNTPLIPDIHTKKTKCSIYRDRNNKSIRILVKTMVESLKKTIRNPWNYLIGIWGFCTSSVSYALNGLWLISYLTLKYKYSRSLSTFIVGLFYIGMAFGSIICGQIANKYKIRKIVIIVAQLLIIIGSVSIIYVLPSDDSDLMMYLVILLNIIAGLGCGAFPVSFALIREYNNYYNCSDTATAFCYACSVASGFAVQYTIGELLDFNWEKRGGDYIDGGHEREYNIDDYDFAFITIPILLGMGIILSCFIKETYGKDIEYPKKDKMAMDTL